MLDFLRRLFRRASAPPLAPGEQYVEDTEQGKLFLAMIKACPDCSLEPPEYMKGPEGGMNVNVFCARCGQGYNVAPQLQWAEKIQRNTYYILPEFKK